MVPTNESVFHGIEFVPLAALGATFAPFLGIAQVLSGGKAVPQSSGRLDVNGRRMDVVPEEDEDGNEIDPDSGAQVNVGVSILILKGFSLDLC